MFLFLFFIRFFSLQPRGTPVCVPRTGPRQRGQESVTDSTCSLLLALLFLVGLRFPGDDLTSLLELSSTVGWKNRMLTAGPGPCESHKIENVECFASFFKRDEVPGTSGFFEAPLCVRSSSFP